VKLCHRLREHAAFGIYRASTDHLPNIYREFNDPWLERWLERWLDFPQPLAGVPLPIRPSSTSSSRPDQAKYLLILRRDLGSSFAPAPFILFFKIRQAHFPGNIIKRWAVIKVGAPRNLCKFNRRYFHPFVREILFSVAPRACMRYTCAHLLSSFGCASV
jgi:hypothetical protein